MSNIDKNKIFFGLLHYIFTEQPNVNWAFKTSLINFTGLNETMNQKKYKNDSISNDIIKYVKEVKPYHVQFNHYIEKYSTKSDECKIKVSDSIFPIIKIRYDNIANYPDIEEYFYSSGNEPNVSMDSLAPNTKYFNTSDGAIYKLVITYIDLKSIKKWMPSTEYYVDTYIKYNDELYICLKNHTSNDDFGTSEWKLVENPIVYKWVYDSVPLENKLYYFKDIDQIKIYKKKYDKKLNIEIFDFYDLEKEDYLYLNETTAANRIFLYKTHDLNLLKEYINSHFKGITIDGSNFNIDRFGYDAFLYDLKRYEEPVKTLAYCFIDTSFEQIAVGANSFSIQSDDILTNNNLKIEIIFNNKSEIIDDYSLNKTDDDNTYILTLFTKTRNNEIINIYKNDILLKQYSTNTFNSSNDEGYTRKFISLSKITLNKETNNYECTLDMPTSSINYNKVAISIEKPNGFRYPIYEFQNYILKDNKVKIIDFINKKYPEDNIDFKNWKVYISIADMSLLYDKIYTWEDIYGISNNKATWENYYKNHGLIQNIDGNDFLNPHYEKERPDELTVIYPQESLMIYKKHEKSNNTKEIFRYNFKNEQEELKSIKSALLIEDFNIGDNTIHVNKDIFKKPYQQKSDNTLIPGKILINSEIIEYYDYEIMEDNSIILKNIRRGTNGTHISEKNKKNTVVYSYSNPKSIPLSLTNSYYYVKNINLPTFTINGDYNSDSSIIVFKNNNINLLSDITQYSTSFNISDNNIILPKYNIYIYNNEYYSIENNENNITISITKDSNTEEIHINKDERDFKIIKKDKDNGIREEMSSKGYLYINDNKIIFKTITKNNDSSFTISDFYNPFAKEFYVDDNPYIPSNKFIEVNKNDYTIISENYNGFENDKIKQNNYIIFNETPNVGESIIIENHSSNPF